MTKQRRPDEHYVDAAYVDAILLASAQAQGIETVGPPQPNPSWQTRTEGAYTVEQFQIDWEHKQVTCPEGKTSSPWTEHVRASGDPYLFARFSHQDCGDCEARHRCTKAKPPAGRTLHLLPQAAHDALARARAIQETDEGQKRYHRRAGIESTLAQGVKSCGLRRSRSA